MSNTETAPRKKTSRKPKTKRTTPLGPGSDLNLMTAMRVFATEESARTFLEAQRWPNGPYCPHCGNGDESRIHKIPANPAKKVRAGLFECYECEKQFTVTINTIFEDSHIPLHKWMIAFYRMSASKTQVSAAQLRRELEIGSYKSAWFMCHRIRHALKVCPEPGDKMTGTVIADESYFGGQRRGQGSGFNPDKTPVVSLFDGNRVRSTVTEKVTGPVLDALLKKHIDTSAHLRTDQHDFYTPIGKGFASHETVNHSKKEWARTDKETGERVSTNIAEAYFGNSKRSLDGTHHNVSRKHLPLYMAELDHKYNTRDLTDGERTVIGIGMIEGKRLTLHPMKKSDGKPIL